MKDEGQSGLTGGRREGEGEHGRMPVSKAQGFTGSMSKRRQAGEVKAEIMKTESEN